MTDKEKLNMLIEAIDYSFWNPTEKDYNRELTYPVIDKVKFVKRMLNESQDCKGTAFCKHIRILVPQSLLLPHRFQNRYKTTRLRNAYSI